MKYSMKYSMKGTLLAAVASCITLWRVQWPVLVRTAAQ